MTVQDAYIARRCSEIDQLIQYAVIKSANDQELGAHLADYISVLINGVVEVTIEYGLTALGPSGDCCRPNTGTGTPSTNDSPVGLTKASGHKCINIAATTRIWNT